MNYAPFYTVNVSDKASDVDYMTHVCTVWMHMDRGGKRQQGAAAGGGGGGG